MWVSKENASKQVVTSLYFLCLCVCFLFFSPSSCQFLRDGYCVEKLPVFISLCDGMFPAANPVWRQDLKERLDGHEDGFAFLLFCVCLICPFVNSVLFNDTLMLYSFKLSFCFLLPFVSSFVISIMLFSSPFGKMDR